jgi:hypothetical protein
MGLSRWGLRNSVMIPVGYRVTQALSCYCADRRLKRSIRRCDGQEQASRSARSGGLRTHVDRRTRITAIDLRTRLNCPAIRSSAVGVRGKQAPVDCLVCERLSADRRNCSRRALRVAGTGAFIIRVGESPMLAVVPIANSI